MLSVGPVGPVILTIRTITVAGWLTTIIATTSYGQAIPDDVSRLAVGTAIVGTFKYIARKTQKPAHEVYLAGKEMGRLEILREQANAEAIVRLDDHRRMRAAMPGERQAIGGGHWFR